MSNNSILISRLIQLGTGQTGGPGDHALPPAAAGLKRGHEAGTASARAPDTTRRDACWKKTWRTRAAT